MVKTLFKNLRRPSSHYIPEVDGLRFIAIAAVFVYHVNTSAEHLDSPLLHSLRFGVQLFFAISGYILARPFAKHYLANGPKPDIRRYYLRRLRRIEPPYIICMVIIYFCKSGFGGWHHLIASLFYVHSAMYGDLSPTNVVAWSLEVEVQFYVLAPLIFRALRLRPLFRGCIYAAASVIPLVQPFGQRGELSLFGHISFFIAGVLAADLDAQGKINLKHTAAARFLRLPAISIIGGMCYSIYLWHWVLIGFFMRYVHVHNIFAESILLAIPVMGITTALFVFIERPFMTGAFERKHHQRKVTVQHTTPPELQYHLAHIQFVDGREVRSDEGVHTWADLAEGNSDDPEFMNTLDGMRAGELRRFGGGAQPIVEIIAMLSGPSTNISEAPMPGGFN